VLAFAQAVAPALGAVVEALQVTDNGGDTASAAAHEFGIPLRTLGGDPLEQLTAAAAAPGVVAVVVGTRELPGRRAVGHLTLWLANHADTPVLVVPPDARPTERVRRVLIAIEGSLTSRRSLKRTIELATDAGVELIVVHVADVDSIPMFSDQAVYETEAYATEFLARYVRAAPAARLELRVGIPADEILAAADDTAPDLLAIGWYQDADPTRGVVARELLARSHVPVLLVALEP
jgi:nucleotide-binding universal stress UspA family protein